MLLLPMNLSAPQRQTLAWLVIALVLGGLLWALAPVMTPFLIAAVLAYALHPVVERLVYRRVPRALAVGLTVGSVLLGVAVLLLLVVPILSRELPLLREQIPMLARRLNDWAAPWLAHTGIKLQLDVAGIQNLVRNALSGNLEEWLGTVLSSLRIGGSVVLAVVGNVVLVPVVLFYLLQDWPSVVTQAGRLVPPRYRAQVEDFLGECDELLGQYLRGQLMVMLSLAGYYILGLSLAGFELALPVGLLTGLLIVIPYLGYGLGLLLALLAALLQFSGSYGLIAVAIVYGAGQVLESFVLTPRLVGERVGLSPVAVIFALLAFGHLLGFVGVLIALPLAALTAVAWRRARATYLESELYRG
ncbi:ABC transporter permease [Vitreoscilla filiformis]|uniref:ABC transporter permease n=2 Tax=Vitreoscilla filiformis TaxID=63 RepID=A0A221KH06_VITFI|nr:ABC transporter permease [Vitreoscilla filiformis]